MLPDTFTAVHEMADPVMEVVNGMESVSPEQIVSGNVPGCD